eukprot:GSA25T00019528001.1
MDEWISLKDKGDFDIEAVDQARVWKTYNKFMGEQKLTSFPVDKCQNLKSECTTLHKMKSGDALGLVNFKLLKAWNTFCDIQDSQGNKTDSSSSQLVLDLEELRTTLQLPAEVENRLILKRLDKDMKVSLASPKATTMATKARQSKAGTQTNYKGKGKKGSKQ